MTDRVIAKKFTVQVVPDTFQDAPEPRAPWPMKELAEEGLIIAEDLADMLQHRVDVLRHFEDKFYEAKGAL